MRELAFSAGGNALRALVLRMTGEKDEPVDVVALGNETTQVRCLSWRCSRLVGTRDEKRAQPARLRPVEGDVIEPLTPKMASNLGLIGNERRGCFEGLSAVL